MAALDDAKILCAAWEAAGADEYRRAQLCGFLSVVAVREFELQIKETLINYAQRCHGNFGFYVAKDFERLNGRILIEDINTHLGRFGTSFRQKFVDLHRQATAESLANYNVDVVNAYNSIVLNRHAFVHKGNLTLSLPEAKQYIDLSPRVIACVTQALS